MSLTIILVNLSSDAERRDADAAAVAEDIDSYRYASRHEQQTQEKQESK
jgi:hypothetical protein